MKRRQISILEKIDLLNEGIQENKSEVMQAYNI